MKRIMGATTLLLVLVSALAGCKSTGGLSTAGGKEKITYWTPINVNAVSVIQNYDELLMYQEVEKKFNIDLEFKHPPTGQQAEQFNLMLASRDLPDVLEYDWVSSYSGGPGKAISDGIIVSLNDLIEDGKMPNFKKVVDDNPGLVKMLTTDKGDYYVFPSLSLDTYTNFGGFYLRKDWLDELGLDVPETIDEWEAVLTAFKEKKGATAPFSVIKEYMSESNNNIWTPAFGVGMHFYVEDDVVKFGPMEEGYKEYLKLMKKWMDNGLLDQDVISNDWKIVDAKMLSGKSGAGYGAVGAKFGKYLTLAKETGDTSFNLVAAPQVVMNKGEKSGFGNYVPEYTGSDSAAITTKNTKRELTAQVLDYFYSEEGAKLKNFGVEGVTYNDENGYPRYTELITKNPDGLAMSQAMAKYFRANVGAPGFSNAPEYLEQYYEYDGQRDAIKIYNDNVEENAKNYYPVQAAMTPEEASEYASIMNEVDTYRNEMFVKFLIGTEPIENYDKFIDTMNSLGMQKALKIKQDAYDRFIK